MKNLVHIISRPLHLNMQLFVCVNLETKHEVLEDDTMEKQFVVF